MKQVRQLAFEMKQTIPVTLALLIEDGLKHIDEHHPKSTDEETFRAAVSAV
jgi:hypothetical protein